VSRTTTPCRLDEGRRGVPPPFGLRVQTFQVGNQRLAVLQDHEADAPLILKQWEPWAADFDLLEPFARIREAIEEARRSATRPS
jgi:hypothetical protein